MGSSIKAPRLPDLDRLCGASIVCLHVRMIKYPNISAIAHNFCLWKSLPFNEWDASQPFLQSILKSIHHSKAKDNEKTALFLKHREALDGARNV